MSSWPHVLLLFVTRCLYWGGTSDLGMPDCKCQAELAPDCKCQANLISDCHVDLPIWALTAEISYCHSWPLDATMGVDLPVDLPIWALTLEMSYHYSWPLDATMGGRSASWSTNISCNSRNVKLPFLTTRCYYQGVDLPVDLPIWALTVICQYEL